MNCSNRMMRIIEVGDIAWQGRTEPVFCRAENGEDLDLQARVLAFDWWIANSDRVFIEGAATRIFFGGKNTRNW